MAVAIMFHSVGLRGHQWRSRQVSEEIVPFRRKLVALVRAGYRSIHMEEAVQLGDADPKAVWLTFDDGYLDNWVHVFPVLEELGLKATIFVTADFVDPRTVVRERCLPGEPDDARHDPPCCCAGFLSWEELRLMAASGLVEVQSHGLTHTWHFKGPGVVDYWRPGAATEQGGPGWMLWNLLPERKPFYLTEAADLESAIPWGMPVYENGKSLVTRRYFPNPAPARTVTAYVSGRGGRSFFGNRNWRTTLDRLVQAECGQAGPGGFETDDDFRTRVGFELTESRRLIEQHLRTEVTGICWPGGGVTPEVLHLARDAGYRHFTLPSAWRRSRDAEQSQGMMPRLGSAGALSWRGIDCGVPSPTEFLWLLERWQGSRRAKWLGRAALAARLPLAIVRSAVVRATSVVGVKPSVGPTGHP